MVGNAITAVAYYYFDFSHGEKQKVASFVRSVIAQLCTQWNCIPDSVQELYRSYHHLQPDLEKLVDVLMSLLNICTGVYIVIDALDECSDRELLLRIISRMHHNGIVRLMATSRRESDIEQELGPLTKWTTNLTNSAHHEDIRLYIQTQLRNNPVLKSWPKTTRSQIEKSLVDGAHGMYVYSSC